jgi:hypothetical protein
MVIKQFPNVPISKEQSYTNKQLCSTFSRRTTMIRYHLQDLPETLEDEISEITQPEKSGD